MKTSSLIKFGFSSSERRDLKAYLFFLLIFSAFGNSSSDAFTTNINPASHLALTSNKQQRQQLHHQLWLASDWCKSESDNRQLQSSTTTSPTNVKTTTTTADIMHPKTIAHLLQPKNVDALQTILLRTIPPLTSSAHKGSSGRIAILGGSEKYTGAPYYAAMAALRTGVDLASIYCAQEASIAIKSYSPELMVDSVYEAREIQAKKGGLDVDGDEDDDDDRKRVVKSIVENVMESLGRMHALVIGPGLGRDPIVMDATAQIIHEANKLGVSMVLDADALYLLSLPRYHWLVEKIKETMTNVESTSAASRPVIVLTPNVVEYKRLVDGIANGSHEQFQDLLPGVVVIQKGHNDTIRVHPMNSENRGEKVEMICEELGGLKRSGGIGDILAGSVGALLAWNKILSTKPYSSGNSDTNMDLALSCWIACSFTKRATYKAFEKRKRSMTAPDILEEIGAVVDEVASSTIQS